MFPGNLFEALDGVKQIAILQRSRELNVADEQYYIISSTARIDEKILDDQEAITELVGSGMVTIFLFKMCR